MRVKEIEIRVVQGDITGLSAGAIVNAANTKLLMGGGVAGAIKRAGGVGIEEEAVKKGPILAGAAIATRAGTLKAEYIIHAATMEMDFVTDEVKIRDSYANALKAADELGVASIVFPALGCGVGGFPLKASAKIAAQEFLRYARAPGEKRTKEILFCLRDEASFALAEATIGGYIRHMLDTLADGPLSTVDAIIEFGGGIVLIERSNPPFGWALPGGFVDTGESLEAAVVREAREETNLELDGLRQFHTYSAPGRDPRFHTIATVFTAAGRGVPRSGDDAAAIRVAGEKDIGAIKLAFDHGKILGDFFRYRRGEDPFAGQP